VSLDEQQQLEEHNMTRTFFGVVASLALAGSLVVAQDQQPESRPQPSPEQRAPMPPLPQSGEQKAPDMTLTGCLVQGSSPTVFLLENAKTATDPATSPGKSYVLQIGPGSAVDLKSHLNHQVRVVGTSAMTGPPAPGPSGGSDEKTMAKLSARTVTMVADTCPTS
jgi:hypothetical protein